MDALSENRADTQLGFATDNNDCLVDLVNRAENAEGGIDENPELTTEFNRHVFMDVKDEEVELMC